MKRQIWFFQFVLLVFLTLPLAIVPRKISLKVGGFLGSLLFLFWRSRRTIAIENLKAAVARNAITTDSDPELIIGRNFRNLGKSFIEIIKIYYGLDAAILHDIEIRGMENFEKAREKGKGIIFITGHCGNWELIGIALSAKLTKINGVARPQKNPYLNRIIEKAREKHGNHVIYKKGALKKILTALKRKEAVGILMDQSVIRAEGVITEFLGKKAYTMKMPAVIARKTGAAVLPVFIRRNNDGHIIEIGEAIELDKSEDNDRAVLNDTVSFIGRIEEYIRRNPSEWLWMHRRWKRIQPE